jgi:hypothetical protein
MRSVVSNVPRKVYGSSPPVDVVPAGAAFSVVDGWKVTDEPGVVVGAGVYAGGGSLEGTVKAFIPGRSGRRVAGDGFEKGFGFGLGVLRPVLPEKGFPIFSIDLDEVLECVECVDLLLFLRPSLRIDPKIERRSGARESEGIVLL